MESLRSTTLDPTVEMDILAEEFIFIGRSLKSIETSLYPLRQQKVRIYSRLRKLCTDQYGNIDYGLIEELMSKYREREEGGANLTVEPGEPKEEQLID